MPKVVRPPIVAAGQMHDALSFPRYCDDLHKMWRAWPSSPVAVPTATRADSNRPPGFQLSFMALRATKVGMKTLLGQ